MFLPFSDINSHTHTHRHREMNDHHVPLRGKVSLQEGKSPAALIVQHGSRLKVQSTLWRGLSSCPRWQVPLVFDLSQSRVSAYLLRELTAFSKDKWAIMTAN